jgi:hypothetical protein
MRKRIANTVNGSVKLKAPNYATDTERKRHIASQIQKYEESLLRLQIELSEAITRTQKSDLRARIQVIRELQKLSFLELKGLKRGV